MSVVSNNAGLSAAYGSALGSTGSTTIELAPGAVFSGFVFNGGSSTTAGAITIETEPGVVGGSAAVFEGVTIRNTSGGLTTFSGLAFNNIGDPGGGGVVSAANLAFDDDDFSTAGLTVPATGAKTAYAFTVNASSDISFNADNFHGVSYSNLNDTFSGLTLTYNNNIAVTDSTFSALHDAIAYQNAGGSSAGALGVDISNNSFQYLFDDAIRGAGSNVLVANNTFYSQHPDPTDTDHPDSIQLWTSGDGLASYNIEVIGNESVRGQSLFGGLDYGVAAGPPTVADDIGFNTPANPAQGAFLKDEAGVGTSTLPTSESGGRKAPFGGVWELEPSGLWGRPSAVGVAPDDRIDERPRTLHNATLNSGL